ncbi:unnamed protein product [Adineta steineri]|uniref:Uncharacterized protein n=2 Tax=Adineta steineri TaxID=433720 RepID=A0A815N5P7_9BILA|nr:unnamed protein product [Adineta steineri]CAF3693524.1 unnamed protein product [Adineta steineri]CAF3833653.1 unnamed protein product [Adineta steineri]
MSSVFPNNFNNNTTNNQLVNVSMLVEKPCPVVAPYVVSYFYGSPIGWNAVLVGLLSSILAIIFLLTCLYYLIGRRRYFNESDSPTPVALVEKNGVSGIPVTTSSQTATTTFMNEPGKETKISTYTEQGLTSNGNGDFMLGMPTMGNGHTGSSSTNGLLANGSADPSELRLLQHEHH